MKSRLATLLILTLIFGLLLPDAASAEFSVPPGFDDQLIVDDVPSPTAIDWLPDGQLLIATQDGVLYRSPAPGIKTPVLDLSGEICSGGEMGLLGLAVDPAFAAGQRFIYLYYTDRKGNGSCNEAGNRANRVSKFAVDANFGVGGEQVLIDNIAARGGNHNGGDLQFDKQGMLYIGVGDGGVDLVTGDRQNGNGNARRLSLLNGKILRIQADGSIPPGNPFTGAGTAPCASTGQAPVLRGEVEAEKKTRKAKKKRKKKKRKQKRKKRRQLQNASVCQEIFATGLRNPYRIAFDPDSSGSDQRFYINDVGGGAWEEIDQGAAGADYGWNVREGPCPTGTSGDCAPDGRFTEPVFAYPHSTGCRTITGGAFVPDSSGWPGAYRDAYLYADFICDTLFVLRNGPGGPVSEAFGAGSAATHLAFGPDNALYYTTFNAGGQVRRIAYQG